MEQFELDVKTIKPRPFDTYVLPAFLLWFALRSKAGMGKWSRRVLFTSGIYMVYRNFSEYQTAYTALKEKLKRGEATPSGVLSTVMPSGAFSTILSSIRDESGIAPRTATGGGQVS